MNRLWKSEAHSYKYNPFNKTLNFNETRPTDYKLNTRVVLPKPKDGDSEFQCEIRKRAYEDAFKEYLDTKGHSHDTHKKEKGAGLLRHQTSLIRQG